MSPIAAAQDYVLSALARAHGRYLALTDWATRTTDTQSIDDEAGNYSTEMVVIIAGIVLLAIALIAVITRKVMDKANAIDF